MARDDDEYEALLHKYDDPVYAEQPPGFDRTAAEERFKKAHRLLEKRVDAALEAETGTLIQDASFHGQIRMGEYGDEIVVIRFSNFGNMVAISGETCLPPDLRDRVRETLDDCNYVRIPESVLGPYTGANPGVTGIRSWWIRYFDWI